MKRKPGKKEEVVVVVVILGMLFLCCNLCFHSVLRYFNVSIIISVVVSSKYIRVFLFRIIIRREKTIHTF